MTEIYLHFIFAHYGLYGNAPVSRAGAIRVGSEMDTEKVGKLKIGEEIAVTKQKELDDGTMRVKFERGWTSVMAGKSGRPLLELVGEQTAQEVTDEKEQEHERKLEAMQQQQQEQMVQIQKQLEQAQQQMQAQQQQQMGAQQTALKLQQQQMQEHIAAQKQRMQQKEEAQAAQLQQDADKLQQEQGQMRTEQQQLQKQLQHHQQESQLTTQQQQQQLKQATQHLLTATQSNVSQMPPPLPSPVAASVQHQYEPPQGYQAVDTQQQQTTMFYQQPPASLIMPGGGEDRGRVPDDELFRCLQKYHLDHYYFKLATIGVRVEDDLRQMTETDMEELQMNKFDKKRLLMLCSNAQSDVHHRPSHIAAPSPLSRLPPDAHPAPSSPRGDAHFLDEPIESLLEERDYFAESILFLRCAVAADQRGRGGDPTAALEAALLYSEGISRIQGAYHL